MRSMRKATAWAMALAVVSATTIGTTAYAEGEAVTTTVPTITTEASTETPTQAVTEAPTQTPTEASTQAPTMPAVLSADFGTVKIIVDTAKNTLEEYDSATGVRESIENSVYKVDCIVYKETDFKFDVENLTEEQLTVYNAIQQLQIPIIDKVEFSDNVVDLNELDLNYEVFDDNVTVKFGKNVKVINPDLFKDVDSNITVQGYTGTVAETYAKNNNYTFIALDAPVATTTTAIDSTTQTTANATTTAKATTAKATTTAKPSDSPKTGNKGIGAIAGIAGLATIAGFIALRKKEK